MYGTKLCLATSAQFGISVEEQISLFKKVGFDGFFVYWAKGVDIAAFKKIADEENMIFQSIHAPFRKMDQMWEMQDAEEAVEELIQCLHDCYDNDIPVMVVHAYIGFTKHEPTPFGIRNFEKVVKEAEKLKKVKIAFENTEGEEYLAALMEHFSSSEQVGFCWDTGHEMCYNHGKDMLALYGDKLIATHINDNLGIRDYDGKITYIDDLHMLPFDGIADWNDIVGRLNKYDFHDILTFELNTKSKPGRHENDVYDQMDIELYVTEVFKRACRVAAMKQRIV